MPNTSKKLIFCANCSIAGSRTSHFIFKPLFTQSKTKIWTFEEKKLGVRIRPPINVGKHSKVSCSWLPPWVPISSWKENSENSRKIMMNRLLKYFGFMHTLLQWEVQEKLQKPHKTGGFKPDGGRVGDQLEGVKNKWILTLPSPPPPPPPPREANGSFSSSNPRKYTTTVFRSLPKTCSYGLTCCSILESIESHVRHQLESTAVIPAKSLWKGRKKA